MDDETLYLYCFARAACFEETLLLWPAGAPALLLLREGSLVALLARVDRRSYCGDEAEERLADPSWVAAEVATHTAVVEWARQHSPVFPARFGTLFSSCERVRTLMRRQGRVIADVLNHVDHKAEWAVKIWFDPAVATQRRADVLAAAMPELRALPVGVRYLREKQLQLQAAQQLGTWLKQVEMATFDRLLQHAQQLHSRSPLPLDTRPQRLVANWALLVHERQADHFGTVVDVINQDLADEGVRLELSGPWPPYSFCMPLAEEDS